MKFLTHTSLVQESKIISNRDKQSITINRSHKSINKISDNCKLSKVQ